MRKSNVKIKGKLRTYLYLPLLLTMLLIIINVFVYMEDTSSGVLFSGFVLLYFVIMLIAYPVSYTHLDVYKRQEQQFIVYFQPKYQLKKMAPYGAEALVRWKKPSGEIVLPNEFIPIFERNGFITKLDYYVWEKVCQFIDSELSQGRNPAPISVNVSRVNLYNPDFMDSLIDLIHRYHIPPHYLNLELTESVFSEDAELIQRAVNYLHDAGFTILMDDFGSGYSSLNILKDVDLDVLKIDMKFFSKGNTAEKGAKIIDAVIRMAESLDMMVIAEGVEEKHQVDFLNDLGCDYIQGYYFGRPMSQDQYEKLTNHDEEEQHDMPQPESS